MANSPWRRDALIYMPRKKATNNTVVQNINVVPSVQSNGDYYKSGSTYTYTGSTGFARAYCYNPNVNANLKVNNKTVGLIRPGSNYMTYCRFYKMSSGYTMTELVSNLYWRPTSGNTLLTGWSSPYIYYCVDNTIYKIKNTTQSQPYIMAGIRFKEQSYTVDGITFYLQHTVDTNNIIQTLQTKLGSLYKSTSLLIISDKSFTDEEILEQVKYGAGYTSYNTVTDFDLGV